MSKRVLLIGGNYAPELTGIGKYNGEMMNFLAGKGYDCTVVTTFPYYPHWKVDPAFATASRWFKRETTIVDGNSLPIKITRCPHYIPGDPSGLKRILSDFSFSFSASMIILKLLFTKKYDYVMVVAPPFQLGILGVLYKKIKGAKFLYHIQDLQIDAARDLKLIKSEFIINLLLKVEKYILKRADVVSSISQGMIGKIEKKYRREVVFFPNWVDTDLFFPIPGKEILKQEFGFDTKDTILLYSGAIGEKQGLESILEAAKELQDHPGVKFVICGSGPYKKRLQEISNNQQLNNVLFLPLQPFDQLNRFLNMADIHLVLQKANATDLVMPSKLTAILSVGGVSIITANEGSSLYNVVSSNKMGMLIEPENPAALIAATKKILAEKNGAATINNARIYAEQYLSIDEIFKKFMVHLS